MNPYHLPILCIVACIFLGFPGGSDGKESAWNVGDLGSIPELGRSPGGWAWQPHSSILAWRIPMDGGAWRAAVYELSELDATGQLCTAQHVSVNNILLIHPSHNPNFPLWQT